MSALLRTISFAIPCVLVLPLAVATTLKVHSDLYTRERKSLQHRRFKPELTPTYTKTMKLSCVVQYFYWLYLFIAFIHSIQPSHDADCIGSLSVLTLLRGWFLQAAKFSLYMIFLYRLDLLYIGTVFAYAQSKIKKCFYVLIVYNLILMAAIVWAIGSDKYCSETVGQVQSNAAVMIMAAMMILQDLFCAVGFLIAFILPTRRTLKLIERTMADSITKTMTQKERGKFFYSVVKVTNLTVTAVVSSVVFLVLGITPLALLFPIDSLLNCICVALMLPYFPDVVYYQRLCCACVACCTPKSDAYQSQVRGYIDDNEQSRASVETETVDAISGTRSQDTVSIDTHDQPKRTAEAAGTVIVSDSDIMANQK